MGFRTLARVTQCCAMRGEITSYTSTFKSCSVDLQPSTFKQQATSNKTTLFNSPPNLNLNMFFLTAYFALALFAIQLLLTQGQEIIGCADLNCLPLDQATTLFNCTVASKSFGAVGVARIPTNTPYLPKMTWTEGAAIYDRDTQPIFDKSFYLGAPPHTNLTGTGACAVFFNNANATFKSGPREDVSTGTCQDALGPDCVNALL